MRSLRRPMHPQTVRLRFLLAHADRRVLTDLVERHYAHLLRSGNAADHRLADAMHALLERHWSQNMADRGVIRPGDIW